MGIKNVVALIREESRVAVVDALQRHSIHGISIASIRGYGEYQNSFALDTSNTCIRIDVMIEASRAQQVAQLIMDAAHTGLDGDGLVAIQPVENLYRVKTRTEIESFEPA